MLILRSLEQEIRARLGRGKAIIILGARQIGKTTLLKSMFSNQDEVLWLNADDPMVQALFARMSPDTFISHLGDATTVIIDEAQRIENIGLNLKLLQDALGDSVQFIATGSSSFDLANKINEPLTGRKWEFRMYPLTFAELVANHGLLKERSLLETRLRFGSYPEVVTNPGDEQAILFGLASDNLYKDVFNWEEVRKPKRLEDLLRALAYQIGSQVNLTELGSLVGLDKNTVDKYLRLLEQSYIIFRLGSFSKNLRNELKFSGKYYFYDVGIRNALIGDFTPMQVRADRGHLFENYIIAEMIKRRPPFSTNPSSFFWRTTAKQEIDYVEQNNGKLSAYEIKWSPQVKSRFPVSFLSNYKPEQTAIIHPDNYTDYLS